MLWVDALVWKPVFQVRLATGRAIVFRLLVEPVPIDTLRGRSLSRRMTTTATIEQLLSALSKRRESRSRLFSRSCGRRRRHRHRTLQPDRLDLDWVSRGNSRGIQNGSNLNCRHGCVHCLSMDISRNLDIDSAIGRHCRIPSGVLNHRLSSLHTLESFEAASPHIDDITNSHSLNIRLCVDLTS